MPELPEVEQVKNSLRPYIKNKIIKNIEINVSRLIKYPDSHTFETRIVNRRINDIIRRGKYLIILLDGDLRLVIHLRMTGSLIFKKDSTYPPDKPRVIFYLTDGSILYYCDTRTLGTIHLLTPEENPISGLNKLGPEPISPSFSLKYFTHACQSQKRTLKAMLLDQSVIAGLGNIYVDEALAASHLHPAMLANALNNKQISTLHKAIKDIIKQAIANRGTTFRDYKDADGAKGSNQEHLLVYGRKGKPCPFCQMPLVYAKIAGRGTVFCPDCQKIPEQRPYIIGLTGTIASGKTTVAHYLSGLGIAVFDADKVAHMLMLPNSGAWQEILHVFGPGIMDDNNEINRKRLAEMVFGIPEKLKKLEEILHNKIWHQVELFIDIATKQKKPLIVIDAPLLIEANWHKHTDSVWLVTASPEIQAQRALKRDNISYEDFEKRLSKQINVEHKKKFANVIIDNSGNLDETYSQVKAALSKLPKKVYRAIDIK